MTSFSPPAAPAPTTAQIAAAITPQIVTDNLTDAAVTAHLTPAAVDAAVTIAGITAKLDATAVRGKIDAATVTANLTDAAVTAHLTQAAVRAQENKTGFSAHKNGTTQSIVANTPTLVTFGTELYDTGSLYASNRWTPPAGIIHLAAFAYVAPASTATVIMTLRKNNSPFAVAQELLAAGSLSIDVMDRSNGTDYYEVWIEGAASAVDVAGIGAQYSRFMGHVLADL